ncbi:MAG: hypothetical protein QNK89_00430 [Lacinutrix sp.]|uniref:hypothetical protein n=1 Tax=Lacinutrix sp. TaxID=1937692 RepID=UPI0030954046
MIKHLNNPKNNIIAVIIVEIITLSITFTADFSGAGVLGSVVLKWVPAIIGITTLLFYFVSRLFTKKHNWYISLLGILTMLFVTYNLYTTDFSQTL